jgi:hypothetical protein
MIITLDMIVPIIGIGLEILGFLILLIGGGYYVFKIWTN